MIRTAVYKGTLAPDRCGAGRTTRWTQLLTSGTTPASSRDTSLPLLCPPPPKRLPSPNCIEMAWLAARLPAPSCSRRRGVAAAAARAFLGERHSEGDGTKAAAGANARAAHTCAKGALRQNQVEGTPWQVREREGEREAGRSAARAAGSCTRSGLRGRHSLGFRLLLQHSPPSSHHKCGGDAHGGGRPLREAHEASKNLACKAQLYSAKTDFGSFKSNVGFS